MYKKFFHFIPLLFLSVHLMAQTGKPRQQSSYSQRNTFPRCVHYEIFVRSFADSNGDSIGDFHGLAAKMDYLQKLGVESIWLMPVFQSPSYHKYDVTDYYNTDKEYGRIKDLIYVVDEAHKRNMKVIIDLPLNHCSNKHPWFVSACNDEKSEYINYFVWNDISKISTEPEHWHFAKDDNGKEISGKKYYGFFSQEMPDLNYDNPAVRKEAIKIAKFWLNETGVDGFRLDAADKIYSSHAQNHVWWKEFSDSLKKIKPYIYLVGEIWDQTKVVESYMLTNSLQSCFNFDLANAVLNSVEKESVSDFFPKYFLMKQRFKKELLMSIDATFLSNHDQTRVMTRLKNDAAKAKLAAAILFTLPGAPFIYYGEEIGMTGDKPDEHIREPFIWAKKDTGNTKWINAKYTIEDNIASLEEQSSDQNSILNFYRKWINIRNHSIVLQVGEVLQTGITEKGILSFYRTFTSGRLLIVHNLSASIKTIQLTGEELKMTQPVVQYEKDSYVKDGKLSIAPLSTLVLQEP